MQLRRHAPLLQWLQVVSVQRRPARRRLTLLISNRHGWVWTKSSKHLVPSSADARSGAPAAGRESRSPPPIFGITAEHEVLCWHIPSPKVALYELHQLAAAPAQDGFEAIQCETARLLKGGLWWKRQLMSIGHYIDEGRPAMSECGGERLIQIRGILHAKP